MEDFVQFEIAKKLKEKGFPQHITEDAYIIDNYGEDEYEIGDRLPIPLIPDYMDDVAAPTISQVLKWLREEKNIHITIDLLPSGYYAMIYIGISKKNNDFNWKDFYDDLNIYESYELATLAGIEHVLDNLI
jgi:hypothetical protein